MDKNMNEKDLKKRLIEMERSIVNFEHLLKKRRNSTIKKFPTTFLFLSTFGLVCMLYGLEKIIDTTPLLSHNPFILVVVGVAVLILTGALYRKL
jgi:uncharacterized membrane protein